MYTLSKIAETFARLDAIAPEDRAAYEKGLRNLAQRNHLPPADVSGRVFLYDDAGAASIRMIQIAHAFGIGRMALEALTQFLAGHRLEIMARVQGGETFNVAICMGADGRFRALSDWSRPAADDAGRERRQRAAQMAGRAHAPEIARFTLPASEIARDVLAALKG